MAIYLLGSHKTEIASAISKRGLLPQEFSWEQRRSSGYGTVEALVHRPTQYYCVFDGDSGNRYCTFSPGNDAVVNARGSVSSWNEQRQWVINWVDNVKREIEAPDPWSATFSDAIPSGAYQWEVDNSPFTEAERREISTTLRELEKNLLARYELSERDKKLISARFSYLEEATKRQGRKDWIHTAIGVAVTIGFSFLTSPQLAKDVLTVVSRLSQTFFGGAFPQLTP